MVAISNGCVGAVWYRCCNRLDQVRRSHRIPRARDEELRSRDRRKMFRVSGSRLAHGNDRVTEIDETDRWEPRICHDVSTDPASHGLSCQDDIIRVGREAIGSSGVHLDEFRQPVRCLPSPLGVEIVERQGRKTECRQSITHPNHPRMGLTSASTMGEDDSRPTWRLWHGQFSRDRPKRGLDLERASHGNGAYGVCQTSEIGHRSSVIGHPSSVIGYRLVMDVEVYATIEGVGRAAADLVEEAIAAMPELSLGLAGGSTPPLVHRNLAERDIAWERVTAWMTDERWVPPNHPDSNQRMARETLVDATGVSFLAPDTNLDDPHVSAMQFEHMLRNFGIGSDRHSVVMLGMGPDGHTASLFPDTEALTINDRMYVANWVAAHDTWRLTATYDLLNRSDTVLFVVTGENKAEMIRQIANGDRYPASDVDPRGEVRWLLDEAAASLL